MIRKIVVVLLAGVLLSACSTNKSKPQDDEKTAEKGSYIKLKPEEAKTMMDNGEDYLILDVRTPEEYQVSRIRTAYLLPVDELSKRVELEIPNKDTVIFVYCRSGNRSRTATLKLIELGYSRVYDIGGIIDWPYDIAND